MRPKFLVQDSPGISSTHCGFRNSSNLLEQRAPTIRRLWCLIYLFSGVSYLWQPTATNCWFKGSNMGLTKNNVRVMIHRNKQPWILYIIIYSSYLRFLKLIRGTYILWNIPKKKIIRSTSTSKVCRLFYIDLSQWFTSRKESIPHWLVIYVIFSSVRSPDSKPFFFFAKWHVPNVPHVEHRSKRRLHLLGPCLKKNNCRINWGQIVWSWLIMSMHASYRVL